MKYKISDAISILSFSTKVDFEFPSWVAFSLNTVLTHFQAFLKLLKFSVNYRFSIPFFDYSLFTSFNFGQSKPFLKR